MLSRASGPTCAFSGAGGRGQGQLGRASAAVVLDEGGAVELLAPRVVRGGVAARRPRARPGRAGGPLVRRPARGGASERDVLRIVAGRGAWARSARVRRGGALARIRCRRRAARARGASRRRW